MFARYDYCNNKKILIFNGCNYKKWHIIKVKSCYSICVQYVHTYVIFQECICISSCKHEALLAKFKPITLDIKSQNRENEKDLERQKARERMFDRDREKEKERERERERERIQKSLATKKDIKLMDVSLLQVFQYHLTSIDFSY